MKRNYSFHSFPHSFCHKNFLFLSVFFCLLLLLLLFALVRKVCMYSKEEKQRIGRFYSLLWQYIDFESQNHLCFLEERNSLSIFTNHCLFVFSSSCFLSLYLMFIFSFLRSLCARIFFSLTTVKFLFDEDGCICVYRNINNYVLINPFGIFSIG